MRIFKLLLFAMVSLIFFGCNNPSSKLDTKELESYFETSDIQYHIENNNRAEVIVSNSPFVNKERKKKGAKWQNAESFASMGALIAASDLDSSTLAVDTISLSIKIDNAEESYMFNVADLKKVRRYVDVSRLFLDTWGKNDFVNAQSYLGKEILNIYPTEEEIKKALSPVFLGGVINKSELIAFKISEGIASLYMNAYCENGLGQTYVLNFILSNSDNKIVGITVP
jgi:hypothetical protein